MKLEGYKCDLCKRAFEIDSKKISGVYLSKGDNPMSTATEPQNTLNAHVCYDCATVAKHWLDKRMGRQIADQANRVDDMGTK